MRAREFLVRRKGEDGVTLRNLIREPLGVEELRRLAAQVGGPAELVAPKRRTEAEGLSGERLLAWLAEDGARVRRPIVVAGKKVSLGFTKAVEAELDAAL